MPTTTAVVRPATGQDIDTMHERSAWKPGDAEFYARVNIMYAVDVDGVLAGLFSPVTAGLATHHDAYVDAVPGMYPPGDYRLRVVYQNIAWVAPGAEYLDIKVAANEYATAQGWPPVNDDPDRPIPGTTRGNRYWRSH